MAILLARNATSICSLPDIRLRWRACMKRFRGPLEAFEAPLWPVHINRADYKTMQYCH